MYFAEEASTGTCFPCDSISQPINYNDCAGHPNNYGENGALWVEYCGMACPNYAVDLPDDTREPVACNDDVACEEDGTVCEYVAENVGFCKTCENIGVCWINHTGFYQWLSIIV